MKLSNKYDMFMKHVEKMYDTRRDIQHATIDDIAKTCKPRCIMNPDLKAKAVGCHVN